MYHLIKTGINIIRNIDLSSSSNVKHLGRWNYINCYNSLNKKIERANIDHCGPCGNDQEILKIHHNKNNLK